MEDAQQDLQAASAEAQTAAADASQAAQETEQAAVAIAASAHDEAKGVFESIMSKLENFEHALAADAKAELEKLKALLHL